MRAPRIRLLVAGLTALGVGGLFLSPAIAQSNTGKIMVCHVPPGNPSNAHAITIDENAWARGHTPHNAHNMDFVVDADRPCSGDGGRTTTVTTQF